MFAQVGSLDESVGTTTPAFYLRKTTHFARVQRNSLLQLTVGVAIACRLAPS